MNNLQIAADFRMILHNSKTPPVDRRRFA